jgi:uncharacterized surface protein with fasciclin (FAS1) repeats
MSNNEGINQDQMVAPSTDTRLETHRVLETLAALKDCSVFYHMLCSANAESLLRRPGLYTLLVPSNEGLRELAGRSSENEVADLVSSCLLEGAVKTEDLSTRTEVRTANGTEISISNQQGTLHFGSAKIVRPDVICTNGIIHVLDRTPVTWLAAKRQKRVRNADPMGIPAEVMAE